MQSGRPFISLRYKILLLMLLMMIIPLLVLGTLAYLTSSEIVRTKFASSNVQTVRLVASNIDLMLRDVNDISLFIIQNESVRTFLGLAPSGIRSEDLQRLAKVEASIMYLVISKPFIHSVLIEGYNGLVFDPMGTHERLGPDLVARAEALRGGSHWISSRVAENDATKIASLSQVRQINDINRITRHLGLLKVNVAEEAIHRVYADKLTDSGSVFYVVSGEGEILSSSDRRLVQAKAAGIMEGLPMGERKEGYAEKRTGGRSILYTYAPLSVADWTVVNAVPVRNLVAETDVIRNIMLAAVGSTFLAGLAVALFFSAAVIAPLKNVRLLMDRIESEDFDVFIEPRGNDEITLLLHGFNLMSRRLKELVQNVYLSRIEAREAELQALQAQINPHFLYNTLDTIYWLGRIEKAFQTSEVVEALSKLFRLSLNNGNELTSVRNECEHLRNYIKIQKVRYKDRIDFDFCVDPGLNEVRTVKLVLQPLVENAIYHGLENKGGPGRVSITVRSDGEDLLLVVEDTGVGADPRELEGLLTSKSGPGNRGFGIRNVHERIRLRHGEPYGLEFARGEHGGLLVRARQPLGVETGDDTVAPDR